MNNVKWITVSSSTFFFKDGFYFEIKKGRQEEMDNL